MSLALLRISFGKPSMCAISFQLERRGTKKNVDGMARYAITAPKVFGVSVGDIRGHREENGARTTSSRWSSGIGWYEARMLAAFVDDPKLVTPAQMDRQVSRFDNWAICDTFAFIYSTDSARVGRRSRSGAGRKRVRETRLVRAPGVGCPSRQESAPTLLSFGRSAD